MREALAQVRRRAGVFAPLALSLLGLVALRLVGPDLLSQERLADWVRPLGVWAPLAFILFLALRPLTLLPGQLLTAMGGALFGALHGTVYSLIGDFLAGLIVFGLGRRYGRRLLRRMGDERYLALRSTARRHDFSFALIATMSPIVPTDLATAAAAASGGRFRATMSGMMLATLPGVFLTAQFGSALSQGKGALAFVSASGLILSLLLGMRLGRQIAREVREGAARSPGPPGMRQPA